FLDRVWRDEDVGRFGLEVVFRRAEKTESFFGNFQIAGTVVRRAIGLSAHSSIVFVRRTCPSSWHESHMNFEFRENRRPEPLRNHSLFLEATGFGPMTKD